MSALTLQNAPWTPAHETVLRSLWADPSKSAEDVAETMQRSWQSCRVKAGFMELGRRPTGVPTAKNAFWTPERVAVLKDGIAAGRFMSVLARELGCTRNACIGKATRMGFTQPAAASPPMRLAKAATPTVRLGSSTRNAPPKARLTVVGNNTVIEHPQRPPLVLTRADVWRPLPDSKPRPFETRRLSDCNWPVEVEGEIEGTMRCCLPVEHGGYCSTHRAIARAPRQPRDAKPGQLARSLRRYA